MSGYQEREKFSRRTLGFSILGCVVLIVMSMFTQTSLDWDKKMLQGEIALAFHDYKDAVLEKCVRLVCLYNGEAKQEVLGQEYIEANWELAPGAKEGSSTGIMDRCCDCINSFKSLYGAVEQVQSKQELADLRRRFEFCVQEADRVLADLERQIKAKLTEEEQKFQEWLDTEGVMNI